MKQILFYSKKDQYKEFSNFARFKQIVDGKEYITNEHYYQSKKTNIPSLEDWIRIAPTPYASKCVGSSLRESERVPNWNEIRVDVMLKGLRAKFTQNKDLMKLLLETEDAELHEDSPTDMFWGMHGEDMLGKLLMSLRTELSKKY